MNCSLIQEKLSCYLDGILDEATMEAIELHLDVCFACRKELSLLKAVMLAASEIEEVAPPAGLRDSIREAIAAETVASEAPCEEYFVALSAYADGELSPTEAKEVVAHTDNCPACARELQMLKSLTGAMMMVEEIEPPVDLRERIAAATTKAPTLRSLTARLLESLVPSRVGFAAAGTLAAAAIIGYLTVGPATPPEPIAAKVQPNQPHAPQMAQEEIQVALETAVPEMPVAVPVSEMTSETVAAQPVIEAAAEDLTPVRITSAQNYTAQTRPIIRRAQLPTIEERVNLARHAEATAPKAETVQEPLRTQVVENGEVPATSEPSGAEPIRLRIAESDIDYTDRLERFMQDVKIEVKRKQQPDDYARVDIFKITR